MSATLNSRSGRIADLPPGRNFGLTLALLLAALASVAAAAFPPLDGSWGVPGTDAAAAAAFSLGQSGPPALKPVPAKAVPLSRDEANVKALADAAAKRYRISIQAMRELVDTAYAEAKRNRLDPLLVIAVMAIESRFNPIAQSNAGATGLMQVIPQYHEDKFSPEDGESMLDPRTNIKVGVQALREYIVRGGTEVAGLQLYNGASGDTSNAYANRVLAERARLQIAVRRARDQLGAGLAVLG